MIKEKTRICTFFSSPSEEDFPVSNINKKRYAFRPKNSKNPKNAMLLSSKTIEKQENHFLISTFQIFKSSN